MKPVLTLIAACAAGPALAHDGAHLHPHTASNGWLPLILAGLAIIAAAGLARRRRS
ncbi:LPXTG cell wall anchor domain-containing protein [Sedimentitalea sp. HM32M-2]|uniref:LPXTG cell wall anchor domain-containing protein n=1 Tax=Sedimentitalea sp. HM32M-2 TaxID=3351566 RepID=UPI00363DAB43